MSLSLLSFFQCTHECAQALNSPVGSLADVQLNRAWRVRRTDLCQPASIHPIRRATRAGAGRRQAVQDTGTADIIAISGFIIEILAVLFSAIFSRLPGRWRGGCCGAATAAIGIAVYTLLLGVAAGDRRGLRCPMPSCWRLCRGAPCCVPTGMGGLS